MIVAELMATAAELPTVYDPLQELIGETATRKLTRYGPAVAPLSLVTLNSMTLRPECSIAVGESELPGGPPLTEMLSVAEAVPSVRSSSAMLPAAVYGRSTTRVASTIVLELSDTAEPPGRLNEPDHELTGDGTGTTKSIVYGPAVTPLRLVT